MVQLFDIYKKFRSKLGEYILINDYGHHPTEISFTVETIKEIWKKQKIFCLSLNNKLTFFCFR